MEHGLTSGGGGTAVPGPDAVDDAEGVPSGSPDPEPDADAVPVAVAEPGPGNGSGVTPQHSRPAAQSTGHGRKQWCVLGA